MNTILFGAGASIPFFNESLTTKYITDQILNSDNWKYVIEKLNSVNYENYQLISLHDIEPVLKQISHINNSGNLNFEDVAEIIDKISSNGYDNLITSNLFNLILSLFKPKNHFPSQWEHVPFLLREIIAKVILDFHKNKCIQNYSRLISLQTDFIKTVGEKEISVVSLNYDDTVPTSVDKLGDISYCFTDNTQLHKNILNVKDFLLSKRVAYFPHGHLRFVFTDVLNVSYVEDITKAEEMRWNGLFNKGTTDIVNGAFSYDFNTFMTTGKTKDNAFNNMPYSIYYQRLALDFFHSDKIFIIGYSFGDAHINRLLKSFLNINKNRKVYIVDKYDNEVTMVNEYQDNSNIITKIQETFSPDWNIRIDSATFTKIPYHEDEIKKVNQNGYGEIFDRIIFYKKGYHEFLNEFKNVIF